MCSGTSPDRRLVEFIELRDHPYWVATQAHPEFKSRPDRAHPLFRELVGAALSAARRDATRPAPDARRGRPSTPVAAPAAERRRVLTAWPGFRRLADTEVHQGHIWRVVVADFEAPDGTRFERDIVRSPGAVAVVPVIVRRRRAGRSVVLVAQYRAAVRTRADRGPGRHARRRRRAAGADRPARARRGSRLGGGRDGAADRHAPVAGHDRFGVRDLHGDRVHARRARAARAGGAAQRGDRGCRSTRRWRWSSGARSPTPSRRSACCSPIAACATTRR